MTLDEFNAADEMAARTALLACCGSRRWAEQVLARRPFQDSQLLHSTANSIWWALDPGDWIEAFSAHPKIGQKELSRQCSEEQSGIDSAPSQVLEQLARSNQEYEQRFGWIFLVNATGKTAPQMLDLLRARLDNESAKELLVAAEEQSKITELRLTKLLSR